MSGSKTSGKKQRDGLGLGLALMFEGGLFIAMVLLWKRF